MRVVPAAVPRVGAVVEPELPIMKLLSPTMIAWERFGQTPGSNLPDSERKRFDADDSRVEYSFRDPVVEQRLRP